MPNQSYFDVSISVGVFDMLHEGHAELFALMSEHARQKIILVHDDASTFENKHRVPVQPLAERMANVAMYSGALVRPVHDADPTMALVQLREEIMRPSERICYMRGNDWSNFPGRDYIENTAKWTLIFKQYTEGVSSTERRGERGHPL